MSVETFAKQVQKKTAEQIYESSGVEDLDPNLIERTLIRQ